jgi:hypothetical protein
MQIRELPSGGQFSVKGNVVNVPVDIQPTIQSLPRKIDETDCSEFGNFVITLMYTS